MFFESTYLVQFMNTRVGFAVLWHINLRVFLRILLNRYFFNLIQLKAMPPKNPPVRKHPTRAISSIGFRLRWLTPHRSQKQSRYQVREIARLREWPTALVEHRPRLRERGSPQYECRGSIQKKSLLPSHRYRMRL